MFNEIDNFIQLKIGFPLILILKYIFLFLGVLSLIISAMWYKREGKYEPMNALIGSIVFFLVFIIAELNEIADKEKEAVKDKTEQLRFDNLENKIVQKSQLNELKPTFEITNNSVGGILLGMTSSDALKLYSVDKGFIIKNYAPDPGTDSFFGSILIYEKDTSQLLLSLESYDNWQSITQIKVFSDKYHTSNGLYPGMKVSEYLSIYNPNNEKLYWDDFESEEYIIPFNYAAGKNKLFLVLKTEVIKEETVFHGQKAQSFWIKKSGVYQNETMGDMTTYEYVGDPVVHYIKISKEIEFNK